MMSEIPVLLLDLDGVVNAMSKQAPTHVWKAPHWNRGKQLNRDGIEYPMLWSQPVVDWLTALHESGQVEVRWHSTWQDESLKVGALMGLPEFQVQECPEWDEYCAGGSALAARLISECMPGWWKYPAAERVVTQEGRRLVWIDDDIDYQISPQDRGALKQLHELRLVCPDQYTGISPRHMRIVGEAINYWKEHPREQADPQVQVP